MRQKRSSSLAISPLSFQKHIQNGNMILDWFNTGEAVSFAQKLARDIDQLFPPAPQQGRSVNAKKHQKKFDSLVISTSIFAAQHRLNIYKKAKLLNTVKWEMRDSGHEEALINEIIALITRLLN